VAFTQQRTLPRESDWCGLGERTPRAGRGSVRGLSIGSDNMHHGIIRVSDKALSSEAWRRVELADFVGLLHP